MTDVKPWDKMPGESAGAYRAFNDYKNLGVTRSLDGLLDLYAQPTPDGSQTKPPTRSRNTLATWSFRHDWPRRAAAWDDYSIVTENNAMVLTAQYLIEHEMSDYERLRAEWVALMEATPAFKTKTETVDESIGPDGVVIRRQVVTVKMNTTEWLRLSKMRDYISMLGRRSLGMPEKITKQEYDGAIDVNASLDDAKQLLAHLFNSHVERGGSGDIPK